MGRAILAAMDADGKASSRGSWLWLLVLVVYPLSVGPVRLTDPSKARPLVYFSYAPLEWAYRNSNKAVATFYDWYLPLGV